MNGGECLSTVATLYLSTTVSVHSLVSTEVGELGVRLETDFALEWLDTAVDVLVLFQATRRCKRLAAFRAREWPRSRVIGADVLLQLVRMRERLRAVLAVVRLFAVVRMTLLK